MMLPRTLILITVLFACAFAGCEDRNAAPPPDQSAGGIPARPSLWIEQGQTNVVAVDRQVDSGELADAVDNARATAGDARTQWHHASPETRHRWGVKWAAPTLDNHVEYVWVSPQRWSAFRIEGYLVSPPHRPLACGRKAGELVSFPIEELADWFRLHTDDFNGPRDGGFTIAVLEQRFGSPDR